MEQVVSTDSCPKITTNWQITSTPQYLGVHIPVRETHRQLLLRIESDDKIHVGLIGNDGRWTFADGTERLACGMYTVCFGHWAGIINQFEDLVNDPNCSERMLQDFLETNPALLKRHDYQTIIPEAVIQSENEELNESSWRADFVLSPFDQESFCKILELKRPQLRLVRNPKSGHDRFYIALHEAVRQLRDYQDAFTSAATRQRFQNRYGVDVLRPDLQLIIGRRIDAESRIALSRMQKNNYITIRSWDSEIERFRRHFT